MAGIKIEGDRLGVECKIPNCAKKRLSWDRTIYITPPNGKDIQGNPVEVTNCTVAPTRVDVSGGVVFDCESYKPMDAA